jgi:hypothetical protein
MAVESTFPVPEAITFEQALILSQSLIDQIATVALPESEVENAVAALVQTENGARGFFVTYLGDDRPIADAPPTAVLRALQTAPEIVAPLMVKNLVMSTAMAIHHRRNQDEDMVKGSELVRQRSLYLIQQLRTPQLQDQARKLAASLDTDSGEYVAFLQRWGYDSEQRAMMRQALAQTGLLS